MARLHYNLVRTALDGAIDDTVTTFTITAPLREGGNLGSLIPTISGDTLAIRVDDEIMHVTAYTSGSTTITTIARGQDDTVPDSHADAAVLKHVIAKDDLTASTGIDTQGATVNTGETTASSSFTDLATAGPAVTVTVPASGKVKVTLTASCDNTTGGFTQVGFALSGANTVAANDNQSLLFQGSNSMTLSGTWLLTGLTPGSTTITAKYKAPSGTADVQRRNIVVETVP